jgi:thiamine biosynthesis lipoprotein
MNRLNYFFLMSVGIVILIFASCSSNENSENKKEVSKNWLHLEGNAQGTTFSIKYEDKEGRDFSKEIKEIFNEMDQQLSLYIDSSLVSRVNISENEFKENSFNPYFMSVFEKSKSIWVLTDGAFNPLVFPLVEYWGFGKKAESPDEIDNEKINEFLKFLNFDSVRYVFDDASLEISRNPKIKFDFNGIAQGYTVDVLAEFLESKGVKNYMIEVGGETRAKGKNDRDIIWNLGIEKPKDLNEDHELQAILPLNNRSMATSGNYRKFYEKEGVRYSHTIDPKTGYPVQHSLLSATVLADDCTSADAFATAFMVMGVEKTKLFLEMHPELKLDVYLIYDANGKFKTWSSEGIRELIDEDI